MANGDLTLELAFSVGRAMGVVFGATPTPRLPIVIGRDTRLSGTMLEASVTAGIASVGCDVTLVGIVPTPALAFITRAVGAAAGIMITASHNPIQDNGIKCFGRLGFKLSDEEEAAVEACIAAADFPRPTHYGVGRSSTRPELLEQYLASMTAFGEPLPALTVVLDAAYGAAYHAAPEVFERLGARVVRMHAQDDGARINVACGATDLRALCARVSEVARERPQAWVIGAAFDGDADRALFVDEQGEAVNGDHVLYILACDRKRRGLLHGNAVVGTVMSNIGLDHALDAEGISLLRAAVGDRHVLEMMRKRGIPLGGEQSGHVIDLEHGTTGDGIMTAVALSSVLVREKTTLRAAASGLRTAPQVLINVHVADKDVVKRSERVREAIARAEKMLARRGRVLVRPSGTEPLVRVMTEGEDHDEIERLAHQIAEVIREESPG